MSGVSPSLVEAAARAMFEADGTYADGTPATDWESWRSEAEAVLGAVGDALRLEGAQAERAKHQPDISPGDVIHAEPDGTIVLDDGITTWNPSRAAEYLVNAERERIKAAIGALPHGLLETGVDDGQGHHETVEACLWSDVLKVVNE